LTPRQGRDEPRRPGVTSKGGRPATEPDGRAYSLVITRHPRHVREGAHPAAPDHPAWLGALADARSADGVAKGIDSGTYDVWTRDAKDGGHQQPKLHVFIDSVVFDQGLDVVPEILLLLRINMFKQG
jgi:hypothetical protein